jgi:hypothetical protein
VGVGYGFTGPAGTFTPDAAPPDTNGAVGATQYVQWVNESFAVFNKSTGNAVYGPATGNTLWRGFGGPCETNNDGDPIAQYDKAANRWVMTQFSVTGGPPYYQCVAVSQTSDATGAYYRYAFQQPNFNDYPKLGVWPDGYYISYNMFQGNSFAGARACAMDRNQMLTGGAATQVCFPTSTAYGGLLPADLDGSTPPSAGSPNYFVAFGTNSLQLWKFHVDWATPANSTFNGPSILPVAAFSEACAGGACIPQSGTRQLLDSLGDRLMYRLAYRNFGDHEALVVNHSVTNASTVAVRWYELRGLSTTPAVYQQGTYAPDANYRWMGSIAMDHVGNMALGYSVSSSTMHPSIRYTGRAAADPLGTMQAETSVFEGLGSQTRNLDRWGDYSSMSIDPVDDCTFWYTTEYLPYDGIFNWSTRIASFSFPSCGGSTTPPPQGDFSLSATPTTRSVAAGGSATYAVTITPSGGFTSGVNLSVSGLPARFTASFNPNPATSTSTLTVTAPAKNPKSGVYTLTITGTSGGLTHSTSVTLTVQ